MATHRKSLSLDESAARFLRGIVEHVSDSDAYASDTDQATLDTLWTRLDHIVNSLEEVGS